MGEVYLAEDTKLDRQVALKVLLSEVSDDKDRINRFVREAKAASALNHPNILTVYEIGSSNGSQYISTELIKGETLRDLMKRESIELRAALKIVAQITAALGAAHEAGIIHRDIKPENIMIRNDGLVKVLDFGLAKLSPLSAASIETTLPHINTKPGMIVGTVAYMSPEQARGRQIDPRSDIFSLGIVMFELFTGKRPFEGESQLELISSILKDEAPQLRHVSPDLPRELERIVDKSLRKDLDHRYQHIKDLHIDIEDLDEELKFESKLHKSVHPTINGSIHVTNQSQTQSQFRSTLTTSISKTRRFTLLHALIFLSAAVGIFGAVWYLRPAGAPVVANYKAREVATWISVPGELFGTAAFSPDGKMIAFSSTRSGTKGIWLTQTNSTEAIQVTNDVFENTNPIWSPKGDEIAYISRRTGPDGTTQTSIWRVPALGGGTPRTVAAVSDGSAELRRWTTSGKIYYYLRGDLYSIDVSTGGSQQVTSLAERKSEWVGISEDEKTVAFGTWGNGRWQIFTSALAGAGPVELAAGVGRINRPITWAGDHLYFSTVGDSGSALMSVNVVSRKVFQVSPLENESVAVDASSDGRAILLSGSKEESNLWRVDLADQRETPVARDLDAKLWPTVSNDGQQVVFQSIKGLSSGNKLMIGSIVAKSLRPGSDSERPVVLTSQGFLPTWSRDGAQIAFLRRSEVQTELFVVSSSGGAERKLASFGNIGEGYSVSPYNLTQTGVFSWSPDGSRIAYIAERNGFSNLWTVSVSDGVETQITSNTDPSLTINCPIYSPDGRRIAFGVQRKGRDPSGRVIRGIRWVDAAGGDAVDLIEAPRIIRLLGWSSDGIAVIAAEADKDNSGLPPNTNLLKLAIADRAETTIARLKTVYFYNISLSYDNKQVAFASRQQNLDDIWVVPTLGGQSRKLTRNNDTGQYYSRMAWLPDGGAIIFGKQTRFSLLSIMSDMN
jgi:serine/threonine protein kinase